MVGDSQIIIGASIGIATGPHEGATSDDLLRHADLALYAAKQAGRGAYRFYEASMRTAAETRRSLEMDLRGALASDQLAVVYQPIFDVQQDRSEEHTSELQSLMRISYAVFCLKKKTTDKIQTTYTQQH